MSGELFPGNGDPSFGTPIDNGAMIMSGESTLEVTPDITMGGTTGRHDAAMGDANTENTETNSFGDANTEMANPGSVNDKMVLDEKISRILHTDPITTSHNSSSMDSILKKMNQMRSDLLQRVDELFNTATDGIVGDTCDQYLAEVEKLSKRISIIEKATSDTTLRGTSASKWASNVGIRISRRDIPKFQLKSMNLVHFEGEEVFPSVERFLSTFEKVIGSTSDNIEKVWKRYIPLSLSYDYDMWLENDLRQCNNWSEARLLFKKKFGNSRDREEAVRKIYNSFMTDSENIELYE